MKYIAPRRPDPAATIAYEGAKCRVYTDGTWENVWGRPWHEMPETMIYATGSGGAHVVMQGTGRRKHTPIVDDDGLMWDMAGIGAGVVEAPA